MFTSASKEVQLKRNWTGSELKNYKKIPVTFHGFPFAATVIRSPIAHVFPKEVTDHYYGSVQAVPDLSSLHAVSWVDK